MVERSDDIQNQKPEPLAKPELPSSPNKPVPEVLVTSRKTALELYEEALRNNNSGIQK